MNIILTLVFLNGAGEFHTYELDTTSYEQCDRRAQKFEDVWSKRWEVKKDYRLVTANCESLPKW